MTLKVIKKIRSSVFLKMLIIVFLAGLLINIAVSNFFLLHFDPEAYSTGKAHLEKYAHYIISDLGHPPDKSKALKLAKELNLRIKYSGPSGSWTTHPDFPSQEYLRRRLPRRNKMIHVFQRKYFIEIREGNGTFLFSNDKTFTEQHKEYAIYLILLISIILTGTYLSLRRILRPIKWLRQGVNEVSTGNFDKPIPVKKNDELGDLSKSFNNMSTRIKEMIKARDQLLLDVSHELRSPLTRIKLSLEFLKKDTTSSSIAEDIKEIETMITEILESERINSKHGKLEKQKIDIISLLKNLVYEYKRIPPGVVFSSDPGSILFDADEARLRIAFKNIIDNALKYSNEKSNPVEVTVRAIDEKINITFNDTGAGIEKEHLPYIFEPFYRVDRSRSKKTGGYGLGMSLCKKIIEAHKGTVKIESRPGNGTSVFITLPG